MEINLPNLIIDKLFLSGHVEANEKEILNKLNINYILVVGSELEIKFPEVIMITLGIHL